eukprot:m.340084 g.340084  ORF g.340084 m.340084 type:complete len:259 (-) comp19127_c0_seq1:210-986(-)
MSKSKEDKLQDFTSQAHAAARKAEEYHSGALWQKASEQHHKAAEAFEAAKGLTDDKVVRRYLAEYADSHACQAIACEGRRKLSRGKPRPPAGRGKETSIKSSTGNENKAQPPSNTKPNAKSVAGSYYVVNTDSQREKDRQVQPLNDMQPINESAYKILLEEKAAAVEKASKLEQEVATLKEELHQLRKAVYSQVKSEWDGNPSSLNIKPINDSLRNYVTSLRMALDDAESSEDAAPDEYAKHIKELKRLQGIAASARH